MASLLLVATSIPTVGSFSLQQQQQQQQQPRCCLTKSSRRPNVPDSAEETPEWAKPGSDIPPPWAANEGSGVKAASSSSDSPQDLPFFVYLVASSLVAIAAVGSVFEFANKNPIFGVIQPDNPLYTPILGFFSITGLPVSAFLWFRSIKLANKAAEDQDREDGYL